MKFIGGFDFQERMAALMERNQRVQEMRSMRMNGATLKQIGDKYGLTRARVLQIIGKMVEEEEQE
jgi:DNA-directed RNA polymerase sigma subunit (sigma70/sigma32)